MFQTLYETLRTVWRNITNINFFICIARALTFCFYFYFAPLAIVLIAVVTSTRPDRIGKCSRENGKQKQNFVLILHNFIQIVSLFSYFNQFSINTNINIIFSFIFNNIYLTVTYIIRVTLRLCCCNYNIDMMLLLNWCSYWVWIKTLVQFWISKRATIE